MGVAWEGVANGSHKQKMNGNGTSRTDQLLLQTQSEGFMGVMHQGLTIQPT